MKVIKLELGSIPDGIQAACIIAVIGATIVATVSVALNRPIDNRPIQYIDTCTPTEVSRYVAASVGSYNGYTSEDEAIAISNNNRLPAIAPIQPTPELSDDDKELLKRYAETKRQMALMTAYDKQTNGTSQED